MPKGRRGGINWDQAKKDYVERRATGEVLSLDAYAKELGVTTRALKNHVKAEGWYAAVAERTAQVTQRAWDEVEIDQVAVRKMLLAPAMVYAKVQFDLAMALQKAVTELLQDEDFEGLAKLPMKELRQLQQITKELAEVGGGLPKFHQVSVDDHHEEVVANRRQLRALEDKVRQFREFALARRRGLAPSEPEDVTPVAPGAALTRIDG